MNGMNVVNWVSRCTEIIVDGCCGRSRLRKTWDDITCDLVAKALQSILAQERVK